MSWPLVEIGKVVEKVNSWNPIKSGDVESFNYIDLSSVDKDKKVVRLEDVPSLLPSEAPSRARQLVKSDDVLVATVRPNLNGVAKVSNMLEGATASTGCCVLRAKKGELDSNYLYYWVQTSSFVSEMMSKATGANYPAVSDKIIKQSKIPLPPLEEQKRIAAILDKADSVRRKRQQAIDLADDFLRSVFLDMFGDPVTNPKGWEVKPIKNGLKEVKSGWSAKGESYPCKNGELGVLKISAVTSGVFKPSENKFVNKSLAEGRKLVFPSKGDLLFSRANTRELVAATCIVTESRGDVFLPDKLWKITSDCSLLLPEFLHFMIQQPRFKNLLTSQATGTSGSMLNISKDKFENSIGIYPPIDMQEEFKAVFWKVNSLLKSVKASNSKLSDGFNSLSQKAFAGDL